MFIQRERTRTLLSLSNYIISNWTHNVKFFSASHLPLSTQSDADYYEKKSFSGKESNLTRVSVIKVSTHLQTFPAGDLIEKISHLVSYTQGWFPEGFSVPSLTQQIYYIKTLTICQVFFDIFLFYFKDHRGVSRTIIAPLGQFGCWSYYFFNFFRAASNFLFNFVQ